MPYFITDKANGCSGWATIKDDGEVMGCHTTKQAAIDQMVAISLAEDMTPGGERANPDELSIGDFVSWGANDSRARGRIVRIVRDGDINVPNSSFVITGTSDDPAALIRIYKEMDGKWDSTETLVGHKFSTLTKINSLETNSLRIDSGPQAVIVDIDGILIINGERVEKTYNYLDAMEETEIIIVTGRSNENRQDTEDQLDTLEIDYDQLLMNPNTTSQATEFKKATAEKLLQTYNVILAIDDNENNRAAYRDLGITALSLSDIPATPAEDVEDPEDMQRAINQEPPAYMRAAARKGLEYYSQGLAGDGLTDKTVREARLMADGQVSDDKWIRIAAWIARHMPDLDAPQNSNSNDDGYPGGGLVAHLLWGSGPSKAAARRTMAYAESVVERIRAEENRTKFKSVGINLNQAKEGKLNLVERRVVNDVNFEVRLEPADNSGMKFAGYAAVFNSPSQPLPFIETIAEGAFTRSLKSRNEIKMFMNHNTDIVLASTRSKTLRLVEDSKGLLAEATLPDTTAGRDLAVLMKRGDVHSMSFGFSVPRSGDSWSDDGSQRTLKEIRLHEVSIVTGFPAYEATTANVRSMEILAKRTNVNADALADAMIKLESGESLQPEQADLITEVVAKLKEPAVVVEDAQEPIAIKLKKIELLLKAI